VTVVAVADTHGFLWHVYDDPRLPAGTRSFIEAQGREGHQIGVSSITLVEILYLAEKGRIPGEAFTDVLAHLDRTGASYTEIAVDRLLVRSMERIARTEIPDMPDRIIAATALHLGVPLISRDRRIQASGIQTIW
jgi:PIN domain nuclease of toxin-antitoxin system